MGTKQKQAANTDSQIASLLPCACALKKSGRWMFCPTQGSGHFAVFLFYFFMEQDKLSDVFLQHTFVAVRYMWRSQYVADIIKMILILPNFLCNSRTGIENHSNEICIISKTF